MYNHALNPPPVFIISHRPRIEHTPVGRRYIGETSAGPRLLLGWQEFRKNGYNMLFWPLLSGETSLVCDCKGLLLTALPSWQGRKRKTITKDCHELPAGDREGLHVLPRPAKDCQGRQQTANIPKEC